MALAAERTINGSFGKLFLGNIWLANVNSIDARITIQRRDVPIPGTRHTGYKGMGVTGEGSIAGLKVTSLWLKLVSQYMRTPGSVMPVLTLMYTLGDPENGPDVEKVELLRCKFWEVPFGYKNGEILDESISFTFEDINLLGCLSDNFEGFEPGVGPNSVCPEVVAA